MQTLVDALLADAAAGDSLDRPLYGRLPALVAAEPQRVARFCSELGEEIMPLAVRAFVQGNESFAYTAIAGGPSHLAAGRYDGLGQSRPPPVDDPMLLDHAVELREDHFVRGADLQAAIAVHCARVVGAAVHLHAKTTHLLDQLAFGSQTWGVADLVHSPRQALQEMIRVLSDTPEAEVTVRACALVTSGGEGNGPAKPRYCAVRKTYHFVFVSLGGGFGGARGGGGGGGGGQTLVGVPPRRTQSHESLFLTRAHAAVAMLAEAVCSGSGEARWRNVLTRRGTAAYEGGESIAAARALLQLRAMDAERLPVELLAPAQRLYRSRAGRLEGLAKLSEALCAALTACEADESSSKCSYSTLTAMLDAYRSRVLALLYADECTSLEPARKDVQEAFFAVLREVREVGVPTSRVREQLELVDDLLACLEVAVSAQVVHNAPALEAELRAAFGTGGEGPG